MAGTLADVYVRVRGKTDQLGQDIKIGSVRAGGSAGIASGQAFGSSFGRMVRSALATVGAIAAGAGLLNLGKFGLKAAADMQQAQVAFTTLLHSGSAAKTFLQQLSSFAAATPFELPGLIDDARLLLGVGVAAKNVIPTLTAWGNAAGALGISQDRFNGALLAVTQSMGAGKINAQDMNQIINAGIPIWTLMSEATGKSVTELRKLSSEGKLLSADILPKVQAQMQKDYGGAMAAQSLTLAGVWSTLMDSMRIGLANSLQPLIPVLSGAIPQAAAILTRMLAGASRGMTVFFALFRSGWSGGAGAGAGAIQQLGNAAHGVFDFLAGPGVDAVKRVGAALRDIIDAVATVVRWFNAHRTAATSLLVVMTALAAIYKVTAVTLAIQNAGLVAYLGLTNAVKVATAVWTAVQWLLDGALWASGIPEIVIAIALLVAAIIWVATKTTWFQTAWKATWDFLKAVGAWFAGPFANFFVSAWHVILAGFAFVAPYFRFVFGTIRSIVMLFWAVWSAGWAVVGAVIRAVWSFIGPFVMGQLRSLWAGVVAVVGALVAFWRAEFNVVRAVVTTVFPIVASIVRTVMSVVVTVIGTAWRVAVAAVRAAVNTIIAVVTAIRRIVDLVRTFFGQLRGAAQGGVGSLLAFVASIPGRIVGALGSVAGILYDAGRRIIEGLIRGIESMIGAVGSAIGKIASKVRNALPFSPAKEGPLSGKGDPFLGGRSIGDRIAGGLSSRHDAIALAMNAAITPPPAAPAPPRRPAEDVGKAMEGALERVLGRITLRIDDRTARVADLYARGG